MFSGIVAGTGEITASTAGRLAVVSSDIRSRLRSGDSVAVSGACLTVSELSADEFIADVMPETLRRTTLGTLRRGDRVNLEIALALGDTIGGHLVTGHVDAVGTVTALREEGNARWVTIGVDGSLLQCVAEKGSVAVDGISLTVVDVFDSAFTVSLVPFTLATTNAGGWAAGTRVNVEADLIARYVQRAVAVMRESQAAVKV